MFIKRNMHDKLRRPSNLYRFREKQKTTSKSLKMRENFFINNRVWDILSETRQINNYEMKCGISELL